MSGVAITGVGVRCAAGIGLDPLARLIRSGRTALARRSRMPDPSRYFTGSVDDRLDETLPVLPDARAQILLVDWAVEVARAAAEQARATLDSKRVGLVLASNLEDHPASLAELAVRIGDRLGVLGPRLATSMACASSIAGLDLGRSLLEAHDVDLVVAIGSDVLTPRVVGGFGQLGLLCDQPCAPFSSREGTSLGEGAAALVLERDGERAPALAWLRGEGLAADAHHQTSPEPGGRGTASAVEDALAHAGIEPHEIELVLAHGTGTAANDAAETRGLERCFGEHLEALPVTALKSLFGHAQGAAGMVEIAALLAAWREELMPGIASFVAPPRSGSPPGILARGPRPGAPKHALIIGAGFGGAHAAALVSRVASRARRGAPIPRRELYLRALASVDRSRETLDWRRAVRGLDLRPADEATKLLTLAVSRVLGRRRGRVGLFVAQERSCREAVERLREQLDRHGLEGTAASAFADSLAIMPAGAVTRGLSIDGPLALCVGGPSAALVAFSWAAAAWQRPHAPELMVVAALDEARGRAFAFELAREGPVRVDAAALAGPGGLLEVRARVGDRRELSVPADLEGSCASARVLAQVCQQLRDGEASSLSVTVEDDNVAAALALGRADSN